MVIGQNFTHLNQRHSATAPFTYVAITYVGLRIHISHHSKEMTF